MASCSSISLLIPICKASKGKQLATVNLGSMYSHDGIRVLRFGQANTIEQQLLHILVRSAFVWLPAGHHDLPQDNAVRPDIGLGCKYHFSHRFRCHPTKRHRCLFRQSVACRSSRMNIGAIRFIASGCHSPVIVLLVDMPGKTKVTNFDGEVLTDHAVAGSEVTVNDLL